jgi:hypothetical protein|tara:strand:- start:1466 stop:2116 length:651 start_codon:yes stop_codon:yes gene_type:complete
MLLITETTEDIKLICEADEESGKKDYYIEGIFMQAEQKNRNGRVYPEKTLMKEVKRYNKEYVTNSRAMGELGHPEGPTVNLERVSHLIKEMKVEGNNIIGRAKILDTPYGQIVKNLIDEGAKLGVSSRGMGSLKKNEAGVNEVQEDFMLAAVDIVADPSAPDAFVNGVMENKEWVWENGVLQPREIENMQVELSKADRRKIDEAKVKMFKYFLSRL